jgi:hypothetical protein
LTHAGCGGPAARTRNSAPAPARITLDAIFPASSRSSPSTRLTRSHHGGRLVYTRSAARIPLRLGSERGPVALPIFKIGCFPLCGRAQFDSETLPPPQIQHSPASFSCLPRICSPTCRLPAIQQCEKRGVIRKVLNQHVRPAAAERIQGEVAGGDRNRLRPAAMGAADVVRRVPHDDHIGRID